MDKKPEQDEKLITLQNATEFTSEEIEKYRKEAEHNVAVRLRASAATAMIEKLEREALAKGDPSEALVDVLIDVPGFADRVTINGKVFLQNTIYTVPEKQAATLKDIMSRAWRHEHEYKEPNRQTYIRPRFNASNSGAISRVQ